VVSDLRGNPERAAVEPPVEHDAATDAGADGDEQEVVAAEGELAPGGRITSLSTTTGRSVSRSSSVFSGSSRHAMLGAKSTVDRRTSTKPAAQAPTASIACSFMSSSSS
jgi:hypothetical protein